MGLSLECRTQRVHEELNAIPSRLLQRERPVFIEPLTQREREVLALLCTGASNRDIAGRLVVSERTVESHLSNIYSKAGVKGRTEAMAWALGDEGGQPMPVDLSYGFCPWSRRTVFTRSDSGYVRVVGFQTHRAALAEGTTPPVKPEARLLRFFSVISRMFFPGYANWVEVIRT